MRNLILFAFVVGSTATATANAFQLSEQDARAVGRGNASTATDSDPSAIVYNPAGIAEADGTRVQIGGSLVLADADFTATGSTTKTSTNNSPAVIPQLFVTSKVHDMVTVGIGFHTPFGLAIQWPSGSAISSVAQNDSLRTYFISPSVGIDLKKLLPGLRIGGGIDIVPATVELTQDILFGTDYGTAHLGGTATGIGGRGGVMYRPEALPALSIGATYRSQVKLNFSGTGNFDAPPQYRPMLPPDGNVKTSITLPQSVLGGVSYRVNDPLEFEVDVQWTGWSSFKQLNLTLADGSMQTSQEGYKDALTVRVGAEYALPKYNAAVRVGYIYDQTPIPAQYLTAQVPDSDRHDVCAGGSYQFQNYAVHLGLLWVIPRTRQTASDPYMPLYKGSYDVQALVASLTLAGQFGGK